MSAAADRQLQVRFVSRVASDNEVPDTPFQVPAKLARYGLSEIVNHLLGQDVHVPYDFLIENEFLRTNLLTYVTSKGLSGENELVLEYIEAFPSPNAQQKYPHPDWVSCLDSSSVHGFVFSGCYDGIVRVFEAGKTDKEISVGVGHVAPIKALRVLSSTSLSSSSFSSASSPSSAATSCTLVSASKDMNVVVWDWNSSSVSATASSSSSSKSSAKKKAAAASIASSVTPLFLCAGHQDSVEAVAVCPEGDSDAASFFSVSSKFASAGWDKAILLWDLQAGAVDAARGLGADETKDTNRQDDMENGKRKKQKTEITLASSSSASSSSSPSSFLPSTGSPSTSSGLSRLPRLSPIAALEGHTQAVTCLAWPAASRVYSGSMDHTVRCWDVERETCVNTWHGSKAISDLAFSLETNLLASADCDKLVRLWDPRLDNAKEVIKAFLRSHTGWVTAVKWADSSFSSPHQLASCAHDGCMKLWDIRASIPLVSVEAHDDKALCIDWGNARKEARTSTTAGGSREGMRILTGGADKKIQETSWTRRDGEGKANGEAMDE